MEMTARTPNAILPAEASDTGGAMSDELRARIAELEARVEHLYTLVGAQPQRAGDAGATTAFPPEVVELALAGRKIQAIKLLRERTGLGLAEAKQVVDNID